MLTGEIKSQIDRVSDAFWSGGITNPLEVIEQIEGARHYANTTL
jgi:type I restriction enzyme M protein